MSRIKRASRTRMLHEKTAGVEFQLYRAISQRRATRSKRLAAWRVAVIRVRRELQFYRTTLCLCGICCRVSVCPSVRLSHAGIELQRLRN